jgi:hypothetical protein
MTLDSTNIKVLDKISKEKNIDIEKATKIISGFYKGLIHVMETEKTVIKVPFLGKFMYSEDWKAKKEKIRLDFKNFNFIS